MENLDIVDEHGKIIGEAPRDEIHHKGLLHREIHVWLYTPRGEFIFQKRAADKDTFPDYLDASIGGHVDQGEDWMVAALKELDEEAGLKVTPSNLMFIKEFRTLTKDGQTQTINDALRRVYAMPYEKNLSDLRVEVGKAVGFQPISTQDLAAGKYEKIIPGLVEEECLEIAEKLGF